MRLRFACVALLALSACAGDVPAGEGIALRDPLGLVDDVYGSGNSLRLYVLPAASFACTPASGMVTPEPPDSPDAFADAVVDVTIAMGDVGGYSVTVPPGEYVVLVRGKGTDRVSGLMNVFIATGCASATVGESETVGVTVVLAPIVSMGVCGDSLLSPDEQCETGEPACTECRTTAETLNTTTALPQTTPRIAARAGQRPVVVWDSERRLFLRLFDPEGRPLTGLGPLAVDSSLDDAATSSIAGNEEQGAVAMAPSGRFGIAVTNFSGDANVSVLFFSQNRAQQGATLGARTDAAGIQNSPAIAFHSSGASMVVFRDARSATGLSGRVFDADGAALGAEAFEVGAGQSGADAPAITGTASGFAVAFAAGGDVFVQRFGADGAPADASAQRVGDAGSRSTPAIGALDDGTFLVAWAESDGMGSGVRARIFSDAGAPAGEPFTVNDTVAGEQLEPAIAAAGDRFLVAFRSGASVRARVFSSAGDPSLNREQPPTLGDFEVAASGARPASSAIGSGADRAWWIVWEGPGTDGTDILGRRVPL